ncbi:hypothetical protein SAY87_031888 [Trapa incisa]|uniref:J domain-containing protein n=2 Tax=Trapa TaxID=22665 RepID=A0AAN7RAH9_TRANT|nr:hypothetical protein SAY87_031888 [Trapa incisa]KAK4795857.1 hypothetical protein SAY86_028183 [Trapa natans]
MASACGLIGKIGSSSSSWAQVLRHRNMRKMKFGDRSRVKVSCSMFSSQVMDPYKTLRIHPDASESEVKKAFRQLALQYHPDVCRGSNCGTQFHLINEAYDIVMSNLRGEPNDDLQMGGSSDYYDQGIDEPCRGMNDPDWDMWEEWMGWEGAGIRDYTSHINPYI